MERSLLACMVMSIVAGTTSAQNATSASTSSVCSQSHDESFAAIRNAPGLVPVGAEREREGMLADLVGAFRCLVESPDASESLIRLLEEGNTAGQMFALIGLKSVDPVEFAARVEPYRSVQSEVRMIARDMTGVVPVSQL
jgi:hypothetical protein